jgi:hypothetical protein
MSSVGGVDKDDSRDPSDQGRTRGHGNREDRETRMKVEAKREQKTWLLVHM